MNKLILYILIFIPGFVLAADSGTDSSTVNHELVQWLLNLGFLISGTLGGIILKSVHQSIRDLQQADIDLANKVHLIEVLVAGQYVKKDELEKLANTLMNKLEKIDSKLDRKVDKESLHGSPNEN